MTTSYFLSSGDNRNSILLTEEQFHELKRAKKRIAASEAIESKFSMVINNSQAIEDELEHAIHSEREAPSCDRGILHTTPLASAISNYLLTVKLFTSQLIRHVQCCIPRKRSSINQMVRKLEDMYSDNFSYRLIDSLHDYLSVRGSITHCLSVNRFVTRLQSATADTQVILKPILIKNMIAGTFEFRQSVFEELQAEHDLLSIIKDCNQALRHLKQTALSLVQTTVTQAVQALNDANTLFHSTFSEKSIGVFVIRMSSIGHPKIIERLMVPQNEYLACYKVAESVPRTG